MNLRDHLQERWANAFINSDSYNGILHLAPRSGKSFVAIKIFQKFIGNPRILIAYPDKNIEQSWQTAIKITDYNNPNLKYVTHMSLEKKRESYDLVVIDEIHLLSERQKLALKGILKHNKVLGLSGTLSKYTEQELLEQLNLEVIVNYTLDEAINDGLISDYKITVVRTPLDDENKIYKKDTRTEKAQYKAYTWVIENKGQNLMLNLGRMRIIHNSIAKIKKTREILNGLREERVLVFCANNKTASKLGCKVHSSKFNNQKSFDAFTAGEGNNHLAVCKLGNTGVSFKSLYYVIVNAFDSNSENLTQRICRSLILDEKDKVSHIYIICSLENNENIWLKRALEFFDRNKITYRQQI